MFSSAAETQTVAVGIECYDYQENAEKSYQTTAFKFILRPFIRSTINAIVESEIMMSQTKLPTMFNSLKQQHPHSVVFFLVVLIVLLLSPVSTIAQNIPRVVRSLDWKSDGNEIAIGYDDGTVELVNPSGLVLKTFSVGDLTVFQVIWRPPNEQELAVLTTQSLTLLNPQTETIVTQEFYTDTISWNPDGTMIASNGRGDLGLVYVLDATTLETVQTLQSEFEDYNGALAWHPLDNNLLAAGMFNGEMTVWRVSTGEIVHSQRDRFNNSVSALSWSPSGDKLAVGYGGGKIEIWNTADWTLLADSGQWGGVNNLEWKPDGTQIASVGLMSINIVDSSTGETIYFFRVENSPDDVSWSPDGTKLAYPASDGTLNITPIAEAGTD